jgi:hypothetical protein
MWIREGERDPKQPLMSLACMLVDAPVSFFFNPFSGPPFWRAGPTALNSIAGSCDARPNSFSAESCSRRFWIVDSFTRLCPGCIQYDLECDVGHGSGIMLRSKVLRLDALCEHPMAPRRKPEARMFFLFARRSSTSLDVSPAPAGSVEHERVAFGLVGPGYCWTAGGALV